MNNRKRIVLNTFGSFGDIHPYMALAMELEMRGHEPVIATSALYREKIAGAGLQFLPVRPDLPPPREQDPELMEKVMNPRSGPRFLLEEIIFAAVRESYEDLLGAVAGSDLLITHPATPAGPLVARKTRLPWISTVLAPMSFLSAYDPPVPPYFSWLVNLKILGPGFMRTLLDLAKRQYYPRRLAEFRDELEIPDYGNPIFEGQHSPALVLALFSSLFAAPQPDWPPQTRVTGFAFYDGPHEQEMPADLVEFLQAGAPPIVFTLGSSAVWVAQDFFHESITAAKQLGRRAVLLIGDERNQPREALPANIIAVNYAPYEILLPQASAMVHHGGIGTTSLGLRASLPTLIVPFAFDQHDNAAHAARLGTSRTLNRKNYRAPRVARELEILLTDESYSRRAREVGSRLLKEDGARTAANLIEHHLASSNQFHPGELAYASRH